MALKPPGSRSNVDLAIYGSLMLLQLAVFIGGHAIIGYLLLHLLGIGEGMPAIVDFTRLSPTLVWLIIVATIALDGWVAYHRWLERKKALER